MSNQLQIETIQGIQAPLYPNSIELTCTKVNLTEEGTEQGLPIVDFVLTDVEGKTYVLVLTGRIVSALGTVINATISRLEAARKGH